MKFQIRRVSLWDAKTPPVEGAQLETFDLLRVDGTKHGETEVWTVEVNSLEELLALDDRAGKHGLVVGRPGWDSTGPDREILIADDWLS